MTIKTSQLLVQDALKVINTISAEEALKKINNKECNLIDIRDVRELENMGRIENSIHIPRGMLEFWLDPSSPYYKKEKFEDDKKKLILFCAGGMRSALAVKSLQDMGYKNIAHVDGGFGAMKLNGFKITKKTKS